MHNKLIICLLLLICVPVAYANSSIVFEEDTLSYTNLGFKYRFESRCDNNICLHFAGSLNMTEVIDVVYPNAYLHANVNFFPNALISPYAGISLDAGELLVAWFLLADESADASQLPQVDVQLSYGIKYRLSPELSINSYYKQAYLSGYYIQDGRYDSVGISLTYLFR